jgi:ABC-type multidrug transport system fused ATPase/permease subunit
VNVAFFSGIFIIGVMIPINRWIAVRIGRATEQLMRHKDARVKLVTECIRGIRSVKMCGLEDTMSAISMTHREQEVKFLSRRKYLDAWCVFLWASMPLLVPYVTFVTTVTVLDRTLSASEVFTTIALLNMLIYPMNAYPWIINGVVEASVSIRRLALLLVVPETSNDSFLEDRVNSGHSHREEGRFRLDLGYVCTQVYDVDSIDRGAKLGPRGVYSPPVLLSTSSPPPSPAPIAKSPLIGEASFIVANDVTISWNEEELRRLDRRIMSRAADLATARQIYANRVLKDTSFAVGPVTLRGVRGGMVRPSPY